MLRRPVMVVTRRRHLTATAHEMAAIPDPLAYDTRMGLGGNRCECGCEARDEDKRYERAHRSIPEQRRIHVGSKHGGPCGGCATLNGNAEKEKGLHAEACNPLIPWSER
jgi:hypothetical protein